MSAKQPTAEEIQRQREAACEQMSQHHIRVGRGTNRRFIFEKIDTRAVRVHKGVQLEGTDMILTNKTSVMTPRAALSFWQTCAEETDLPEIQQQGPATSQP